MSRSNCSTASWPRDRGEASANDAPTELVEQVQSYVARFPQGRTLFDVARNVLSLRGPAPLLERVVRSMQEPLSGVGVALTQDGRVCLAEPAAEARRPTAQEDAPWPERAVALHARASGAHPSCDQLLEIGVVPIVGGHLGATYASFVRPDRMPSEPVLASWGVDAQALRGGQPWSLVAEQLSTLCRDAVPVTYRRAFAVDFVRGLLARAGSDALGASPIVLAPGLRHAGIVVGLGTVAAAAAAFGLPVPESRDCGSLARAIAEIYVAALERGVDLVPPPAGEFDFSTVGFERDYLEELPERPGIYWFSDRAGQVLYVGKARQLRTRVASYFAPWGQRRRRFAELMARLWQLHWEETGSELGALLAEIRAIRQLQPPLNVQREIRRRRAVGGDLVLFLPGAQVGHVELLLVRDGRLAGHVATDRRARGMRAVRAALRQAFFCSASPPPAAPAEEQILASWLTQQRHQQSLLDLTDVGGIREAARLVRGYVTDPDLFNERVVLRLPGSRHRRRRGKAKRT